MFQIILYQATPMWQNLLSQSVSDIKSNIYDLHYQDTVTGLFFFSLLNTHFIVTYHHLVEAYDKEKCTKSI